MLQSLSYGKVAQRAEHCVLIKPYSLTNPYSFAISRSHGAHLAHNRMFKILEPPALLIWGGGGPFQNNKAAATSKSMIANFR